LPSSLAIGLESSATTVGTAWFNKSTNDFLMVKVMKEYTNETQNGNLHDRLLNKSRTGIKCYH
jgi:hypothetical protein